MRFAVPNLVLQPSPHMARQSGNLPGNNLPGGAAVETEDGAVLETEDNQAIKLE